MYHIDREFGNSKQDIDETTLALFVTLTTEARGRSESSKIAKELLEGLIVDVDKEFEGDAQDLYCPLGILINDDGREFKTRKAFEDRIAKLYDELLNKGYTGMDIEGGYVYLLQDPNKRTAMLAEVAEQELDFD
jgi:hypothetical protein